MAARLPPALDLLIVEDTPAEALLLVEVLHSLCPQCHLHVVTDGQQALGFLRRAPGFETVPTPNLVLLDLDLPVLSGFEVLTAAKADPRLRLIPVVVFSALARDGEVTRAYDLHANSVLIKPTSYEAYLTTVRSLERFWCHTAQLPTAAMTAARTE